MKNVIMFCTVGLSCALAAGCGTEQPSNQQHGEQTNASAVQPRPADEASRRETSHRPAQKTIELGRDVTLEMVLIPAGSFIMGDNDGLDDEQPAHRVTITKPFYMGTHEVTVEQFRQFVEATNYVTDAEQGTGFQGAFAWNHDTAEFEMRDEYSWRTTGFAQGDNHPVVNVSWNDAAEFCKWLSREEEMFVRLPTEAEWEYACRAGTTTDYFSGNEIEGVAKSVTWRMPPSRSNSRVGGAINVQRWPRLYRARWQLRAQRVWPV